MELCSCIPEIVPLEKEVPDRYQLLQRTAFGRFSSRDSLEVKDVQGILTDVAGKVNYNNRLKRVKAALDAAAAPPLTVDAAKAKEALETVLCFLGATRTKKEKPGTIPYRLVVPNQKPIPADNWPTFIANPGLIDPNNIPAVTIEPTTTKKVNAHVLPIKATVYKNETLRRCLQLSGKIPEVDIHKIMSAFYDNLVAIHIGKEVNYSDLFFLQMFIGKTPEAGGQASRIAMASVVEAAKQCYKSVEANSSNDMILHAICECIETTAHSITAAAFTGNIYLDNETIVKTTQHSIRRVAPPDTRHITEKLTQRKTMIEKWFESQEQAKVVAASSSTSDMDITPIHASASDPATEEAIANEQATNFAATSDSTEWLEKEILLKELKELMGTDQFEDIFEELYSLSTRIGLESAEHLPDAEAEADLESPSQEYVIEAEAGLEDLAEAGLENLAEAEAGAEAGPEADLDRTSSKRSLNALVLPPAKKISRAPSKNESVQALASVPPPIKRSYSEAMPDELTQIKLSGRIRNDLLTRTTDRRPIPKCEDLHIYFTNLYRDIFFVAVVDLQPITVYTPVHHPVLVETKLVSDYRLIINKNLLQWIGQLLQRGVELFTTKSDTCSVLMQGYGPLGYIMHISSSKTLQHRALRLLMGIITAQENELLLTIIFDIISSDIDSANIKGQPVEPNIQAKLDTRTTEIKALVRSVISKDFGRLLFFTNTVPNVTRSAEPSDYVRLAIKILYDIKDILQKKLDTLGELLRLDDSLQPDKAPDLGGAIMDYNMNANAKLHTKKKKLGSNKTKKSKNKKPKHKKPKKPKKHKTKNAKNYKSFFNKTLKKY